ncbi:WAT1-related protein [Actinidia chinensis var. chinensis]|uniref:WAT1-related protein n=1 Tax=Actinidia chinensis var. chinensis TaxID=1590841 RepID=A0A2R6RF61_ACTCC|nr:WAT1-related protein [Actinidia chinensis var. chinensis]
MGMKDALPFLGMVSMQFIQVGIIVAIKEATSNGMTKFTFIFYTNAIAALILLPTSFLVHRSNSRPPITFSVLCKFFLIASLGCIAQVSGNIAVQITTASFTNAIFNLSTGSTFVLAVIFRMEEVDFKSSTTLAKSIGTLVSIIGAVIAALYKGPSILMTIPPQSYFPNQLLMQQTNFVLGGLILLIDCLASSASVIAQALILKQFKAELIIVFFYSLFVAIISAIFSLVVERDFGAWSLQPPVRLLAILYSGIVGCAIQLSIAMWCLRKKGPLFCAVFQPLGIVIGAAVDIIFFGDILCMGMLVGSIVIVIGFYSVMWGKAKEREVIKDNGVSSLESTSEEAPLLQNIKETQV